MFLKFPPTKKRKPKNRQDVAKRCFCLHTRHSGLHSSRDRCGRYVGANTKHKKCKPKDRPSGASNNQTKLMDQHVLFYDKPFFKQNKALCGCRRANNKSNWFQWQKALETVQAVRKDIWMV